MADISGCFQNDLHHPAHGNQRSPVTLTGPCFPRSAVCEKTDLEAYDFAGGCWQRTACVLDKFTILGPVCVETGCISYFSRCCCLPLRSEVIEMCGPSCPPIDRKKSWWGGLPNRFLPRQDVVAALVCPEGVSVSFCFERAVKMQVRVCVCPGRVTFTQGPTEGEWHTIANEEPWPLPLMPRAARRG
jgi:hypothetical protein